MSESEAGGRGDCPSVSGRKELSERYNGESALGYLSNKWPTSRAASRWLTLSCSVCFFQSNKFTFLEVEHSSSHVKSMVASIVEEGRLDGEPRGGRSGHPLEHSKTCRRPVTYLYTKCLYSHFRKSSLFLPNNSQRIRPILSSGVEAED